MIARGEEKNLSEPSVKRWTAEAAQWFRQKTCFLSENLHFQTSQVKIIYRIISRVALLFSNSILEVVSVCECLI